MKSKSGDFSLNQEIPIYDYAEVDKYLTHKAKQQGEIWISRPLRKRDKRESWRLAGHDAMNGWGHGGYIGNNWTYRPYDKAVPINILRDVKKIHDRFQDNVSFFVSDYAVPHPDPFIMVTAIDVSNIVFRVWNEPAFDTEVAVE